MIFDDLKQPSRKPETSGRPHRRRRSRQSRHRNVSSFEAAGRFSGHRNHNVDRTHVAWLWVLGLLVAGAMGFAFFLHTQSLAARLLPGDPPSASMVPFVDTIFSPIETGVAAVDAETLSAMESQLQKLRQEAPIEDKDIYGAAATLAGILREGLSDRDRHLKRLDRLSPRLSEGESPAISDAERRHLELAVSISWQRNSTAYRNRVDELLARLMRMEEGRFRIGSAAPEQAALPEQAPPQHE